MLVKNLKIFVLSFFLSSYLFAASQQILNVFDDQETREIQLFIQSQLETSTLGHTLYGNKPICLIGFRVKENMSEDHPFYSLLLNQKQIYDNSLLNALKKLQGNNKSFSITLHESKDKWGYSLYECLFINNKALKKALKKHLKIFQKELKSQENVDELFWEIFKNGFTQSFDNKPILQGILLGYGAQNAITWSKKKIMKHCKNLEEDSVPMYQLKHLMEEYPNGYQSLSEELADFDLKERDNVSIQFYYHTQSKESQKIIRNLKKAERKTKKLLASETFLKDFFSKVNLLSVR